MPRTCFVIMPFDTCFDGIWESVIRPTVTAVGDACIRADDLFRPGSVVDDIINAVKHCDYLIADLTRRNPNVFYELGYAHALSKPVVLLAQDLRDIPFDLRHLRVVEYTDSAGGATRLADQLRKYINSI